MTAKQGKWQRFIKVWAIASTIFPFLVFGLLDLFVLSFEQKAIVIVGGLIGWLAVLVPFLVADWDENRRALIKETCEGDALLKLWEVKIDIADDGSSTVERKIVGINLAEKREYYELESETDPDRDSAYEKHLREIRKMRATVTATHKGEKMSVCKNHDFPPQRAYKVNRVTHVIPVSLQTPLEPDDRFEIVFSEKTEKNAWKLKTDDLEEPNLGDFYQHKVRHVTEKLRYELLLPKAWDFPPDMQTTESRAWSKVKDPSSGRFVAGSKPDIKKVRGSGRWIITWEVEYPKLLNTYRLTYHQMITLNQPTA